MNKQEFIKELEEWEKLSQCKTGSPVMAYTVRECMRLAKELDEPITCEFTYFRYEDSGNNSVKFLQCSHCKTVFPVSATILNANYCPHCGHKKGGAS